MTDIGEKNYLMSGVAKEETAQEILGTVSDVAKESTSQEILEKMNQGATANVVKSIQRISKTVTADSSTTKFTFSEVNPEKTIFFGVYYQAGAMYPLRIDSVTSTSVTVGNVANSMYSMDCRLTVVEFY